MKSAKLVAKYKPVADWNRDPSRRTQNASARLLESDHSRRLFSVDFHGENTIIVIRVGVKSSTGANVLPTYCDESCAWVSGMPFRSVQADADEKS